MMIDGRDYINFAGSSYLGLSGRPPVLMAGVEALRRSGAGYQFARAYGLASPAHLEAEQEAAGLFGTEDAVFLATGYAAGLALIAAMARRFSRIFFDERAHHCLQDAIRASALPHHTYRHLDVGFLEAKLRRLLRPNEQPLIVTDGVYSTFGAIAPLVEIAGLAASYGGGVAIDESHALGVLGAEGRGAHEHLGLDPTQVWVCGSTSKGIGVVGGIVPGPALDVAEVRATPPSRGASPGLPAAAAMCAEAMRIVRTDGSLRARLRQNVIYLKGRLRALGLPVGDSEAPIATFLPSSRGARQLQSELMSAGVLVLASDYIGAPPGGVIRCGIFADHTREQLDRLVAELSRLL
jgi:8-amino-7-oxononanoate synthase